jgi:hypothetical protein
MSSIIVYTKNVTSGRRCKRVSVLHTAPMRCSRFRGVSSEFLHGLVSYTSFACSRNSIVSTLTILWNGRFEVLIPVWAKNLPLTCSGIPSLPRNRFLALLLVDKAATAWGWPLTIYCCGWGRSGAITPPPLYAFMACKVTDFTFFTSLRQSTGSIVSSNIRPTEYCD